MENNRYTLRITDFKKMVRLIVSYVILNMIAFAILIFIIEKGSVDKKAFPLEFLLIAFFVVFTVGFLWIQKKNSEREEVTTDSMGVHTNRFGSLMFSDISAYSLFRTKRKEDIVLILRDGKKIMFGPVNFRKSEDKKMYQEFKSLIASKVPKKR